MTPHERQAVECVMRALGREPFAIQVFAATRLMLAPSDRRRFLLEARDDAIRQTVEEFYSDLSRRCAADVLAFDLKRIPDPFQMWDGAGVLLRPSSKFAALSRIADLGGKDLGTNQIRSILAGERSRRGR